MRHLEHKTIPAETRLVVSHITCDMCGKKNTRGSLEDWTTRSYEVRETTIEMKEGEAYPEGGNHEKTSFDICPECFKEKLIPWMKSQGAEPAITEEDY